MNKIMKINKLIMKKIKMKIQKQKQIIKHKKDQLH